MQLADELQSHLEMHVADNVRAGMTAEEARRQALIALGGMEPTRERVRDQRGLPLLDALTQDVRYAWRGLRRSPTFTIVVILTLAIGSGANAAIFSIFNQALVRVLPVPAPDRLVNLTSPGPKTGRTSTSSTFNSDAVFSYPLFRDIEREQQVFTGVAAYRDFAANISYQEQAWTEDGGLVSGSYFPVLGLKPAVGRLLGADDDRTRDAHHVVVLSHRFWRTRFNADPGVLNDTLVINGQAMTIVGVTPQEFESTALEIRPQVFVPLTMAALMMPGLRNPHADGGPWNGFVDRRDSWLYLFARLKPGTSLDTAQRTVNIPFSAIINDLEFPAQQGLLSKNARERFKSRKLLLEPGPQGQRPERGELGGVFLLLFSVTGIVVLIACANVANLLLARAAARERDLTIRLSLGGSRSRLVVQMLVESFLLASAGGVAGLFVSRWTLSGIASLLPNEYTPLRFELDSTLALFTFALAIAVALLCGLYPALLATRRDLVAALRGGSAGTRSAMRLRTWLATAQIALSMTLLVVAGLFIKSLVNLSHVELGMRVADITTFRLSPELNGYPPSQSSLYFDRVKEAVRALPGATSVTMSTTGVLAGSRSGSNVTVEGFNPGPDANTSADASRIAPDYFRTLGIPLVAGREFTAADVMGAPKVVIVNEAFARKFNLGRDPIGKRMRPGAGRAPDIEIVGLVRDARSSQPKDQPEPQFFLPYRQEDSVGALNFYVRSAEPPERLVSTIRAVIGRIDPTVPVENLRPLASQVGDRTMLDRLVSILSLGLAGLATLLAAIGLYGVLSYNLAQKTRELGLRIALGATALGVWRMVYGHVARMTLVGGIVGAIAAIVVGRLAESQLFQVPGYDVAVTIGAIASIAAVAFVAGCLPAWRAARVSPVVALRDE
jgi:predicted permease